MRSDFRKPLSRNSRRRGSKKWAEQDSNLRTPKRVDLQSTAIGQLCDRPFIKMIFSGLSVTSVKSTVVSSLRVTITVVSSDCAQHYSYVGVMLPYRLGLGTENPHPVLWHNYQSRTCSSTNFLLPVCFSAIGLFVISNNSNASCTSFIG